MKKRNPQEKENFFKMTILLMVTAIFLLTACQPAPIQEVTETFTSEPSQESTPEHTESPPPDSTQTPQNTPTESPVFEPWIILEPVASGLTAPVALAAPDDGSKRRFIVDQVGLIYVVDGEDNLLETPFLDLRTKLVNLNSNYDERGLLGMAFHPDFANNGRFYV
jgi:glucose/arabinose dehydrogenase